MDWNALLQINLTGYFLCAQAFGREMLARGSGVLVHIASIAAGQPQGMSGAYSASKAGVAMLSRQLAFEWGPRGIRSNTVSPGLIRTAHSARVFIKLQVSKNGAKRSCHSGQLDGRLILRMLSSF